MAKARRGLARRLLRGLFLAVAAWVSLTVAAVVAFRWIDPPFTAFMLESRIGALFSSEPGYEFRHEWRDWDQISKQAALAVIASAQGFWLVDSLHHHVDDLGATVGADLQAVKQDGLRIFQRLADHAGQRLA